MLLFSPTNHWLKREKNGKELKLLFPPPTKSNGIWFWETHHVPIVQRFPRNSTCCRRSDSTFLCIKGSLKDPMSYEKFTDDFKRGSPISLEFAEDEKTTPLPSGIPLLQMAENNFEGGPSLVTSGSSMWENVFNCGRNCFQLTISAAGGFW